MLVMENPTSPTPSNPNESQSKSWAMACHLISLISLIGIPFGNILGPLVLWLCFKKQDPLIDENGKESLNFQISMTIYMVVAALLIAVIVGIFLLFALIVANVILVVIATVKANNGEKYRYPFTIRLIK